MVISLILWALSSFGPNNSSARLAADYEQRKASPGSDTEKLNKEFQTEKLESSYAGILGKSIEPAIAPLGFDWKIGISLIMGPVRLPSFSI